MRTNVRATEAGGSGMAAAGKKKGTVGIIGLGIMGGAFAKNLSAAGWHVVGFDPNKARSREAQKAGVELAKSASEVADKTPVILTSLPKPEALATTAREIAAAKLSPRVIVEMSTFKIEDKEKAERILRKA
ncbi:MAG TPA: NAD(P)-binding domain-containing protein, partial [Pseudolabrys sp.]|nr:NAD(P)-binding domain-containing protein [Pseudolabrys sp.]